MSHSPRRLALSVCAVALAAPLALTGCGLGGGSGTKSSSVAATSGSSQSTGSSAPGSSSTPAATEGSKPSKDEVKQGLVKYYGTQGVPTATADKLAGCIVDKGYDKFSAQTLNAMKDGDPKSIDPSDVAHFTTVATQCAPAAGTLPTNLPLPTS